MQTLKQLRMTSRMDEGFVVFLIGMRINRWWKPWKWLSVAAAMPRMMRELETHRELGFLGGESWFGRTTVMLQYWKSEQHLLRYASARGSEHLPAWQAFNKSVGNSGDVGVWHETYVVRPGTYESVYVNMPPFGLGRVGVLAEATGHYARAARRLGVKEEQSESTPAQA